LNETNTAVSLSEALAEGGAAVDHLLEELLSGEAGREARLFEAMRYSALGGGKRLRPFLVLASSRLCGVPDDRALRVGAAIEMIHCYSLIHDDLPAMDDDDLRRGQPTCHKEFDEATAVLAGDALQSLAFEVLAHPATHPSGNVRSDLVQALAIAAGGRGMAGGQMIDLLAGDEFPDVATIARMQRLKTGALIGFSCEAGAILGQAGDERRQALQHYAHDVGLAFQIADDLLDVLGSAEDIGKATQKDEAAGKVTFVSLLGVEKAQERARLLSDQAIGHLEIFGEKAEHLRAMAKFVIERRT
jgi:farnesyl diphosphate synthase